MSNTDCATCQHPTHAGLCGHAITETIRDDVGIFHKPTGITRTLLVGTCRCESDQPPPNCGNCGQPIVPHVNDQGATIRYWTAEFNELCHDCGWPV